ncbi:MAG TPA: hypothetical protein VE081_04220 [Sporichthyaceae bacterium]|nr:hypothetical protein [Sporichthyaceae bacterium]
MDVRWRSVSLLAGLPMLVGVAACGGGGSKDATVPAPLPTVTATIEPSSAPTPSGAATASARPSASASPTTIPAGMVRITFLAANCDGCRFTAVDTTSGRKPTTWASTYVNNGKATVLVPIKVTHDMAFRADYSEPMGIGGARPDLVLGYQGVADGIEVEWATAQTKEQANYCWAGTTADQISIHVLHKVFNDPKDKQTPTGIAFWASPTLPVDTDRYRAADHGGLGDQDYPYCTHD